MERENLLAVISDWSKRDYGHKLVRRRVTLPSELTDSVALVVQGVRRCGKSTLLHQLVDHYQFDPDRCCFVNFEDPRLANYLTFELLDAIVTAFRSQHPNQAEFWFMFDEIQQVNGWEGWVRSQLDRRTGNRFVITGSNASLLSGELGTRLTGRQLTVELYPFDFTEAQTMLPELTLRDYLRLGGFPEPLQRRDGEELLRQYVNDIVERDVRERVGARSSRQIRQVLQLAYESAASEMSLRRVAGAVGIAVETAREYLAACEDAYLLFGIPFYAYSERKRAGYNKKYYPVDSGLRRVAITQTGEDIGKSLECATYLVLRRQFTQVWYWRGRGEVDFVVLDDGREMPVQVSWDGPRERHERALEHFYEEFPRAAEPLWVTAETFSELEFAAKS